MTKGNKMIKCLTIVFVAVSLLFADDCGVGTDGGSVFIERVKDIRMEKEEIYITLNKDNANVNCIFWFYCNGKGVRRSVGFPDYWAEAPESSQPLHNFKTKINGNEIKVKKKLITITEIEGRDSSIHEYKQVYFWKMDFKSNDTTKIENNYTAEYGSCVYSRFQELAYIIGTGSTWEGTIGEGKITFDFSNFISTKWLAPIQVPDSEIKLETNENEVLFTFKNYKPKNEDEELSVKVFTPWNKIYGTSSDQEFSKFINQISKAELRIMRNEVFARHGYVFKDTDLGSYFKKTVWYKPNPNFNLNRISKEEQNTVSEIQEIENRK
jgi:hypothetical protein